VDLVKFTSALPLQISNMKFSKEFNKFDMKLTERTTSSLVTFMEELAVL
jgi:hypothetical protein